MVDEELVALCKPDGLKGFNRFASTNVDEVKHQVKSLFCSHSFRVINRQEPLETGLNYLKAGSTTMVVASYGAEVLVEPGVLEDFYLIQFPLTGAARFNFGRYDDTILPGQAGFQHPDEPLLMHWNASCRMVVLRLDRSRFERFVEGCTGMVQKQPLKLSPVMLLGSAGGQLLVEQVKSHIRCIDRIGSTELPPLLAAHLENSIMSTMLYIQPHNRSHEFSGLLTQSEPAAVSRIREYLEQNADQAIDMGKLAEIAGVPMRTLYYQFQKAMGISPMQLLRDIRLGRARDDLMRRGRNASVTDIAFNWGFEHLGRFSSLYRKRFGELPRETLNRGR